MSALQQILVASGASAGTYATWDSAKKGAGITLSGGNLTAVTTVRDLVLSTIGKSSGKWYWEIKINIDGANGGIGVGPAPITYSNNYLGSGDGSMGYFSNAVKRPSGGAYGANYIANDIIGVALDMDSGTLIFYVNNVSQGTAFTGLSGTFYAGICDTTTESNSITANFGASAFTYTPPSGYNSGLYT